MNKMNNKILLVIPTLNEFGNIQKIYKKIQNSNKKINILFIDDNSFDGTKEVIINLDSLKKFLVTLLSMYFAKLLICKINIRYHFFQQLMN